MASVIGWPGALTGGAFGEVFVWAKGGTLEELLIFGACGGCGGDGARYAREFEYNEGSYCGKEDMGGLYELLSPVS